MYTLMDMHTMQKDSGEVFTHNAPMFQAYVDFCEAGGLPINSDVLMYDMVEGSYKGKKYYRLKIKSAMIAGRKKILVQNLYAQKGRVIEVLCKAVINYITGMNDETHTAEQVEAMIVEHGPILSLLSVNRHTTAKALIDAVIPDSHISADDLSYIDSVYASYTAELEAISANIVKANS